MTTHREIQHALAEPVGVRAFALACAIAMVLVDDPDMDDIFDLLSPHQRMRLGRVVTHAALQATQALQDEIDNKTPEPSVADDQCTCNKKGWIGLTCPVHGDH